MAETPPPGSLLSNFLSGGNVGRTPFGPNPKKKDDWIDPKKLPADQAALLGAGVANVGIGSVESLVSGIKDSLVGQGVLKRFGGEDKIIAAAHDYVSTAASKTGQTELLKELDIDTPEKFGAKYIPFMKAKQSEDNVVRKAEGKPTVEGFGNYEVKVTGRVFINPFRAGKELGKQALVRSTRRGLEEVNLGGDHPELSVFTKKELADYTPEFLARLTYSKQQEIKAAIAQNSTVSYTYIYHQLDKKFNKLVAEYEQDQKKPDEARSSELSKVGKEVKARIFNKNFIRKSFGVLGEIYGELNRATEDPIGFAFDYLVKKPLKYFVKKYLLGKTKLFGKWLGKGWGSKFSKWLVNRGFLGKAVSFVGNQVKFSLEKGLGGLFRKGLFNLGRLAGRVGANLARVAFKTLVSSAVRVVAATAAAAASALAGPVFLMVGGAILVVVIVVLIVMFVVAPLNQDLNPPALAAPLDLTISASCYPSSKVSSDQLISCSMSVKANKKADNAILSATFDTNFTGVGASGECSSVGQTVRCPTSSSPSIAEGQVLGSFNFFATTTSNMTEKTVAQVTILVSSSSAQTSQQVVFINNNGVNCQDPNIPCGWPTNGGLQVYFSETQAALHSDYGKMLGIVNYEGTAFDIFSENNRVCANFDGVVDSVLVPPSPEYPNENHAILLVNKNSGYSARFGHLQTGSVQVRPGQAVSKGQFLGLVGRSGFEKYVNIPNHMHYAIYAPGASYSSGRWGGSIGPDPTKFNELMGGNHFDSEGRLLNNVVTEAINC